MLINVLRISGRNRIYRALIKMYNVRTCSRTVCVIEFRQILLRSGYMMICFDYGRWAYAERGRD